MSLMSPGPRYHYRPVVESVWQRFEVSLHETGKYMPFCRNCGEELFNNPNFCPACGTPRTSRPPPATPGAAPPVGTPVPQAGAAAPAALWASADERVLSVVPNLMKQKNLVKTDFFNIVITSRRLVCVDVNGLVSSGVEEAGKKAKAENKGFFARYQAKMSMIWVCNFSEQLGRMNPDEALAKNPGSFVVPLEELRSLSVSSVVHETGDDCEWNTESWEVRLDTGRGKHVFPTRGDPRSFLQVPDVVRLLGNRLVISS